MPPSTKKPPPQEAAAEGEPLQPGPDRGHRRRRRGGDRRLIVVVVTHRRGGSDTAGLSRDPAGDGQRHAARAAAGLGRPIRPSARRRPRWTGQSFDGTPLAINPGDGKPKLVVFVAHWCPHCQAEVPRVLVQWMASGAQPGRSSRSCGVATGRTARATELAAVGLAPARELADAGPGRQRRLRRPPTPTGCRRYPYLVALGAGRHGEGPHQR